MNGRRGVSLLELVIALVVIGVLASIAIPRYAAVRTRALSAQLQSDLDQLRFAQETFVAEGQRRYAGDVGLLGPFGFAASPGVRVEITEADGSGWSASASHDDAPNLRCSVFHHLSHPAAAWPAVVPGQITCAQSSLDPSGGGRDGVIR